MGRPRLALKRSELYDADAVSTAFLVDPVLPGWRKDYHSYHIQRVLVETPGRLNALRQAVELGVRYLDLTFAFLDIRLDEVQGEAVLMLDDSGLPETIRPYLLARDASAEFLRSGRDIIGRR